MYSNVISSGELKNLQHASADLVLQAGRQVFESWHSIKMISYKNSRDVVTDVDVDVEQELRDDLGNLFPRAGFIVEEGKDTKNDEYNWTIDPVDQSKNYATGFPVFYVQVSLLYKNEPILGHIYNPVSDQLFSASKGNGAFLNGQLLQVADNKRIKLTHDLTVGVFR